MLSAVFSSYHQRALDWSFQRPLALVAVCAVLILAGYFSYRGLGSDLLPEMDEGAFILDYFTPAGTSLTETNRILQHVEQILRHTRRSKSPPAGPACRWVWLR